MTKDIHGRAFDFACSLVRLHRTTTPTKSATPLLNELLRTGLSIGSILEEAESFHDKADFVLRCRASLREARETLYWLRILAATNTIKSPRLAPLTKEARELVASLSAIIRNANASK
jgi:four helix bundle protein